MLANLNCKSTLTWTFGGFMFYMNQKKKLNSVVDHQPSPFLFSAKPLFKKLLLFLNTVCFNASTSKTAAPQQAWPRYYIIFTYFKRICVSRMFLNLTLCQRPLGIRPSSHFLLETWPTCSGTTHQAVSLQGLNHSTVSVLVQDQPVLQVLHEVQIFEGGPGLLPLLLGRSPLIRGALQVILKVHADNTGKDVVHDHYPNVLPPGLDAVEAEELGQQSARVLIQVLEMRNRRKAS